MSALLGWDAEAQDDYGIPLRTMAEWKWDGYEGYRAGQRFLESFARWLAQFETPAERLAWVKFVVDDMIYISAAELDQLISGVYLNLIRPAVVHRVARDLSIPEYRTATVTATTEFKAEQRRCLVLGLSDGARLDLLRRASSGLSHEQFFPSTEITDAKAEQLVRKLDTALHAFASDAPRVFTHVVLVDDFYGSGTSLLDIERDVDGTVKDECGRPRLTGKVQKFLAAVRNLNGLVPLLAEDFQVTIVVYVASTKAVDHITSALSEAELSDRWQLEVVQQLNATAQVTDPALLESSERFWDPVLQDEHKGQAALGYRDCALSVVLYHNAPNNSICPLWADSTGRTKDGKPGRERHALFPRYERHHSERP